MRTRRLASFYLIAQGAGGLLWWLLLLLDSPLRGWFFPSEAGWQAGRLLLVADVIMFGLVSIAAGVLAVREHDRASIVGWITLGATAYATLVAVGWLAEPIGHWLGTVVMIPTLIGTCISVWLLHGQPRIAEIEL